MKSDCAWSCETRNDILNQKAPKMQRKTKKVDHKVPWNNVALGLSILRPRALNYC